MSEQTTMTVEDNKKPKLCSVTETTIKEMSEKYLSLTIKGIDDQEGALAVSEARKKCVKARGQVSRWHEAEKDYWLVGGRQVDAIKNKRTEDITLIENHLKDEEKRISDERDAIVRRKDDVRENARKILVNDAGGIPPILQKSMMPNFIRVAEESSFLEWLESVRAMNLTIKQQEEAKAEQDRLAKVEADRVKKEKEASDLKAQQDSEKLASDNKRIAYELVETKRKLDAQAVEQKKIQDDLAAKQKAIDDIYSPRDRAASTGGYSTDEPVGSSIEVNISKIGQYSSVPVNVAAIEEGWQLSAGAFLEK